MDEYKCDYRCVVEISHGLLMMHDQAYTQSIIHELIFKYDSQHMGCYWCFGAGGLLIMKFLIITLNVWVSVYTQIAVAQWHHMAPWVLANICCLTFRLAVRRHEVLSKLVLTYWSLKPWQQYFANIIKIEQFHYKSRQFSVLVRFHNHIGGSETAQWILSIGIWIFYHLLTCVQGINSGRCCQNMRKHGRRITHKSEPIGWVIRRTVRAWLGALW